MSSETTWTCDGCGRRETGPLYRLQAGGWLQVQIYTSTLRYPGGAVMEVCSDACLRIALEKTLAAPWYQPSIVPDLELVGKS